MGLAPRDKGASTDISEAHVMPKTWESTAGVDRLREDSDQVKTAESPPESHPGAPTKLPGYGK